jgi:hypothetical protein
MLGHDGAAMQEQAPGAGWMHPPIGFPGVRLRGIPFDAQESDIPAFFVSGSKARWAGGPLPRCSRAPQGAGGSVHSASMTLRRMKAAAACLTPSHDDVAPLSQGIETVDVLFVKQGGRFTGEAFAVLPSAAHVEVAVSKNKSYLGRRYVEVFRASKLVRLAQTRGPGSLAPSLHPASTPSTPLHPRTLAAAAAPVACRRPHPQDYYKAVVQEMTSGQAMFAHQQMQMQQHQHMQMQQHRFGPQRRHPGLLTGPGYAPDGAPTMVVKLRGLPWSAGKQDLITWFSELPIQPPTDDQ